MASSCLTKLLRSSSRSCLFSSSACQTRLQSSYGLKSDQVPSAKYGGRHTVTMIPGDGVGPEMMERLKSVFLYTGTPVDFELIDINPVNDNDDDLNMAILSIKRNGCAIKGNIESKASKPGVVSRNVAIRNALDLYVNVLHCKSVPSVVTRHNNIDIVLIRQNTEGEYAMLEHQNVSGVVESLKIVTEWNTERLFRYAFEYARNNNRKKVTIVHKANIMKLTDGLFLSVGERVAKDFPDIKFNNMIIDNCCMQLVSNPWQFDVCVLTNLYGTIVSNLVCGLIGGAGLTGGANYGPKYAVFEPGLRNSGKSLKSRNIANPVAMLMAGCELLRHLHLDYHANVISHAIDKTINFDKVHTFDLKGQASSDELVKNVIKHIKNQLRTEY